MRPIINNSDLIPKFGPYTVATSGLNILLNYLVIPRGGLIGGINEAAMVSLFAGGIDVMVRVHFIRRVFPEGYHPFNLSWQPLMAALVMAAIAFLLSGISLILAAVAGLAVYGYLLSRMGELGKEEYRLFIQEPVERLRSFIASR